MSRTLREIGFSDRIVPKDYGGSVYSLSDDAKNGSPVFKYLGMNDMIIDTDVTPNRGDMLSIYGSISDITAFHGLKSHFREVTTKEEGVEKTAGLLQVKITDIKIASTYKLRVIKGVKIAENPL